MVKNSLKINLPGWSKELFSPYRYKVLYGGRGGAKSWTVARALLILAAKTKKIVLCTREIQASIRDSVHKLLSQQINELGLDTFYNVAQRTIEGINGSAFIFEGLRHNISKIKSYEGVDIAWIEEAHTISKKSLDVLIPTIRREGSEIWITFNPDLEEDEVYRRFVLNTPPGTFLRKVNWYDNPWFPDVLNEERLLCKRTNPTEYEWIWEGECRKCIDGAVYAKEVAEAQESGRICSVPYDPSKPVHTFWDLGWADATAIVLAQKVGLEYRIVDYVEGRQKSLAEYINELQAKKYVYGTDFLPHDAKNAQLAAGGRSILEQLEEMGRTCEIVPKIPIIDGINAVRTIFSQCWFDKDKTADLLQCLRRYHYKVDPITGRWSKEPVHDQWSHGADAFRAFAVAFEERNEKPKKKAVNYNNYIEAGWMV